MMCLKHYHVDMKKRTKICVVLTHLWSERFQKQVYNFKALGLSLGIYCCILRTTSGVAQLENDPKFAWLYCLLQRYGSVVHWKFTLSLASSFNEESLQYCVCFCIVGNTLHFSESKRLIGLSGVFIGVGEILGKITIFVLDKIPRKVLIADWNSAKQWQIYSGWEGWYIWHY